MSKASDIIHASTGSDKETPRWTDPIHPGNPGIYARLMNDYFDTVDQNKDGKIAEDEVKEFLNRKDLSYKTREAFELLHARYPEFAGLHIRMLGNQFDKDDITNFKRATADDVNNPISFYAKKMFNYALAPAFLTPIGSWALVRIGLGRIPRPSYFLQGGAVAGTIGGGIYGGAVATNDLWNKKTIESMEYFNLK